ncbi:MAG TPA: tRNA pseudouridine(38-40) synthase TruA [Candidatus Ozemobacteraceae bacterium]|nr:tRNA pseudouridine(38-40) synthase TruA [Candidatus Ozemobacteraceae bacterium]
MTNPLRHLKLNVTYDGSGYFGFQLQANVPTIQGDLEKAFGIILSESVRVHGSGRTDTGVHALGQVVLIHTTCPIPVDKLIKALNGVLPPAIRVTSVEETSPEFHPRFSAKAKSYRYLFKRVRERTPFLERFYCQVVGEIDVGRMREGAAMFAGEHDFSSFTRSPDTKDNPVRKILSADVTEQGDEIVFDVTGNGFLHNMVRNMARALLLIGRNEMEPHEIVELYRNQDRRRLGPPAPAAGLYLMKVMY